MTAHNSKKEERMGRVFVNDFGTPYKIIEYESSGNILIEFQDGWKTRTSWKRCGKNGSRIKTPFERRNSGVGYMGLLKDGTMPKTSDGTGKDTKEYKTWVDMLGRCYNKKIQEKNPTYIGCTVCERWHCYANFLEDIPFLENYDNWINSKGSHQWSLDKDINQHGIINKVYSPDTCKFVEVKDNAKESANRTSGHRCIIEKDGIIHECTSMTKAGEYIGCCGKTVAKYGKEFTKYDGWNIIIVERGGK